MNRKYEDYIDRLHDEFPDVNIESLHSVLKWGLRRIYHFSTILQDIMIKMDNVSQPFFMYIGFTDSPDRLRQIIRSKNNQHKKLRRLFKEKKLPLDDNYYFGLTDQEYNDYKSNIDFRISLYKLVKETHIRKKVNHIFKINIPEELDWRIDRITSELTNSEYILKREESGFEPLTKQ